MTATGSMREWQGLGPCLSALFVLACACGLTPRARASEGSAAFSLISAGASEVVFRVHAPSPSIEEPEAGADAAVTAEGFYPTGTVGGPELPARSFLIGVPEGTRPRLEIRVLAQTSLPGVWPRPVARSTIELDRNELPAGTEVRVRDSDLYRNTSPASVAVLGHQGRLRELNVVSVTVAPYQWSPDLPGLSIATETEVRVRFEPIAGAAPTERRAAAIEPRWEAVYSAQVLNWPAARAFARSAATRAPGTVAANGSRPGGREPELRIEVDNSEIYRLSYDAAAAAGWSSAGAPIDRVALTERWYEPTLEPPFVERPVPIVTRDLNRNGAFDAGDELLFFGLSAWDRYHPAGRDRRYGRRNAYWLSVRDEAGARMQRVPSFLGRDDLAPESSAAWTERLEGDGVYRNSYASGENFARIHLGTLGIRFDPFCWIGGSPGTYDRSFDLPGFVAMRGARVSLQEIFGLSEDSFLSAGANANNLTLLGSYTLAAKALPRYPIDAGTLATATFGARGNVLRYEVVGLGGPALDWIEWTYDRNFSALDNRMKWATAAGGAREFRLSSFSTSDPSGPQAVVAFDLSDSLQPKLLTYELAQALDQGRGLRLQLDLGGGGARRAFAALRPAAAATPAALGLESADDLAAPGDEDLIVITHPSFAAGIEPLLAQRRAQGFRPRVADVFSIYDQFNGGRAAPTAIRSWLRYLFRTRSTPPSFLLLVGDASEDFAGVIQGQNTQDGSPTGPNRSGPNFVPTQTILSNAFSTQLGPEYVASDEWYVDDLSQDGDTLDFLPDMHVGRLSVGDSEELETIVDKLVAYDNRNDGDVWRNRILQIADDDYSNRIGFSGAYTEYGDEPVFRNSARRVERLIHRDAGFGDVEIDSLFENNYLDSIVCLGRCDSLSVDNPDCRLRRCAVENGVVIRRTHGLLCYAGVNCPPEWQDYMDNNEAGRIYLFPVLKDKIDRGNLIVSYNGHANGLLMSHEYLVVENQFTRRDLDRLQNVSRPFLFLGFGCHLAEFSNYREARRGDGISERFLNNLPNGRGAIGSIASTAYEWLGDNGLYNLAFMESAFLTPPADADGQTRWSAGDLLSGGKYRMVGTVPTETSFGMVQTYCLLGDPTTALDLAPPRLDAVRINGEDWVEGTPLAAATGSDSAQIVVQLRDEVMVRTARIVDRGTVVDPSRYRFVEDPAHPGDDRYRLLEYAAPLEPPALDYELEIQVRDRLDRTRSLRLPVRIETKLETRLPNGTYEEVGPSDFIAPGDSLRVTFTAPVEVERSEITINLDGDEPVDLSATPAGGSATRSRTWQLVWSAPASVTSGGHEVELGLRRRSDGGESTRSFSFQGVSETVELSRVFNFPNPFDDDTTFRYTLNGNASQARLSIFTLRGKRIRELEGQAFRGENVLAWDGRDADGDAVASGVYFYKLVVRRLDGSELKRIDRVARVRR